MNIQLFDYSVNLLQALLWRHNEAEHLQSLLTQKQEWYDVNQEQFWTDWYQNVFDLRTANDFGCAVWSIILNLPLQIGSLPDPEGKPIFGFGFDTMVINPGNGNFNFNNGNFSNGGSSFGLTLEEKRLVLRLRYFQLTSRCAIPEINRFLEYVFSDFPKPPGSKVYVLDGLNMTIRVVFTFNPGSRLRFILETYDLIPRGAGVGISYIITIADIFGFGMFNQNFDNGSFIED